uniref:Uncharacterized protein n=1 Tax=Strigamia maritima TaxID=126957 RepID=T1IWT2_STRMM
MLFLKVATNIYSDSRRESLKTKRGLNTRAKVKPDEQMSLNEFRDVSLSTVFTFSEFSKMSVKRNALGRVAAIGDLYNVRTDTFVGFSIFNGPIPETAIEITRNSYENIDFIHIETVLEKFEKLNVVPELRASILANLVTLDGHAKYLETKRKSKKCCKSFIYSIYTQMEKFNFDEDNDFHDFISIGASGLKLATHFVAGVKWGAKTVISMEKDESDGEDDDLTMQLSELVAAICKMKEGVEKDILDDNHKVQLFSDVLPATRELMSINDAEKMLKEIPLRVKEANKGKGKPISYILLPICELKKYFKVQVELNKTETLDESFVVNFTKLVDEINEVKEEVESVICEFNDHSYCVPVETVRKASQLKTDFEKQEFDLMTKFTDTILSIRSGELDSERAALKYNEFNYGPLLQVIKAEVMRYYEVFERINLVTDLRFEGVIYIGIDDKPSGFDELEYLSTTNDVLILYLPEIEENSQTVLWDRNKNYFFKILQLHSSSIELSSFGAVDLSVRPDLAIAKSADKTLAVNVGHICLLKDGHFVDYDVYGSHLREKEKEICYTKTFGKYEASRKPLNRIKLQLQCPGSVSMYNVQCEITIHKWHCLFCKEELDWGFDEYFYCLCGRALASKYFFLCCDENHKGGYVRFRKKDDIKYLLSAMPPLNELNVLIMGETGVGKTTWINSFLNYLTFSSLEEASNSKHVSVSSTKFQVTDENNVFRTIRFGEDKNEVLQLGQSATQDVRAHIFPIGSTLLRIIDTPGIGDVRGVEQDKKNLQKFFSYLSNIKFLNGICIFLKPNESRLNVYFEFCIKELLTHLHQNAIKNIVFCFTHSKGTSFKPGNTRTPLTELLCKNNIDLELNTDTMYCLDNEGFRYLCAATQGVEFTDSLKKSFAESWNVSVKETNRLISYIKTLEPHLINDTISLNDIKKNIVCLTKPIADISKNIQTNLATINLKQEILSSCEDTEHDLLQMLYVNIIKLEPEPLKHPRTVCGSCVQYHPAADGSVGGVEYIKHCHPHCHLTGVAENIVGDARLQKCTAMNGTLNCTNCGCCWDQHLHITYVQIPTVTKVTVENVALKIKNKEKEYEQKKILQVSAKLGEYLTKNAILPYNDVLVSYINHLIDKEKQKVNICGNDNILKRLDELRRILLNELYALKRNGWQLRSAIEQASVSGSESRLKDYDTVHGDGFEASDRFESCAQAGYAATSNSNKDRERNVNHCKRKLGCSLTMELGEANGAHDQQMKCQEK